MYSVGHVRNGTSGVFGPAIGTRRSPIGAEAEMPPCKVGASLYYHYMPSVHRVDHTVRRVARCVERGHSGDCHHLPFAGVPIDTDDTERVRECPSAQAQSLSQRGCRLTLTGDRQAGLMSETRLRWS